MEASRTTIGGNLLLEKSLVSKKVTSYNGSLNFLSGEAMQMASGHSAFILGTYIPLKIMKIHVCGQKISFKMIFHNFRF